ncbi:metallophosphoesterase [Vagococcus acidifermentans]|uniref:Phosphoesterase n=1 Tax=Vagococcus acidifermentans TaxID=564710 RepID=A0A430AXS0_9ENTE|nr:metallophosphoesterase [Vagococcus acidifermentans]RSU12862.1 YfcE family phosphodiesterase [Vagococcus acidifermentans]
MKYLVVSDNHGDRGILTDLLNTYQGKVDYMFHCGDSELSSTDDLWQHFHVVKGNTDYADDFPLTQTVDTGMDKVFLTHGHRYSVNMTLGDLMFAAAEVDADICLFGHTHKLGVEMMGDVLYLNPGSILSPRGAYRHLRTYAIIESLPDSYEVSYYTRNHQEAAELRRTFLKK